MSAYTLKPIAEIPRETLSDGHRFFLDYFDKKTGGKRLPSRADLNPLEIPRRFLPHISLSDVIYKDGDVVDNYFRLFATGLVPLYSELTGKFIAKHFDEGVKERILATVRYTVKERAPVLIYAQQLSDEKSYVPIKTIYIPLSEDGTLIDQILCYCQFTHQ